MKAAASSWRTWMKRTLFWRVRKASMMALLPSPRNPKITFTLQSRSLSTKKSEVVSATVLPPGRHTYLNFSRPCFHCVCGNGQRPSNCSKKYLLGSPARRLGASLRLKYRGWQGLLANDHKGYGRMILMNKRDVLPVFTLVDW